MKKVLLSACLAALTSTAFAGTEKVSSKFDVLETAKRYIQVLQSEQIPVLNQNSRKNNLTGRQEAIIEFANPLYGLTMGECHRGERKDLAMQARVWKDRNNTVWLEYETPEEYVNEFGVIECGNEVDKIRRALGGFASSVVEP